MSLIRRLLLAVFPCAVWVTIVSVMPATTAYGRDSLRVVSPLLLAVGAPSSMTDPVIARSQLMLGSGITRATPTFAKTFTTDFPLTERPISEDGIWQHHGMSWRYVRTVANRAIGTQSGSGGYDDSYAYLTGFGPDQTAKATLLIDPAVNGNYREVELLLRWADSPTRARGYECNLAWNGSYAEIVRWNGPYGAFTYITRQNTFAPGIMPPKAGDLFKATIAGGTIRVYLNKHDGKGDQLIASGSDTTFADGQPGMGFFIQGNVDPAQFGFSSYAASSD
jgi:hypothetical protein